MHNFFNNDVKEIVYDFFYKFSRFEFALKESGYIKTGARNSALPDWKKFYTKYQTDYVLNKQERELFLSPPKVQSFIKREIHWVDFSFEDGQSELEQLTLLLRAIRNNLFHGGKYGDRSWDDTVRIQYLLIRGICCLDNFSSLSEDLSAHYLGKY